MKALHKVLNVQLKTAIRLLEEVHALDTFQWFTGIITDDGQEDIPVGVPIFRTARLGQKIRRSPQFPLCGVALDNIL